MFYSDIEVYKIKPAQNLSNLLALKISVIPNVSRQVVEPTHKSVTPRKQPVKLMSFGLVDEERKLAAKGTDELRQPAGLESESQHSTSTGLGENEVIDCDDSKKSGRALKIY